MEKSAKKMSGKKRNYYLICRALIAMIMNLGYIYGTTKVVICMLMILLIIVETACRYRAPARFDDLLEVHSFVEGTRSKGFRIGHRVHRVQSDGALELLVEGHTSMVTVGEDRKPVPLPPRFVEAFAAG